MDIVKTLAVAGSFLVFAAVIELVRRGRLKERYSLVWLFASLLMLLLSLFRSVLEYLSRLLGIFYPPSLLFLVAFAFLLLIALHFSVVISGLSEKNKRLAQELALLRHDFQTQMNAMKNGRGKQG